MGKRDPRIDAYIADSANFAKPILDHIRATVHEACPNVEETMKWSFPHFMHQGILCSMASFKQHCALSFWKASLLFDGQMRADKDSMGNFGRITRVEDLPSRKKLLALLQRAMKLNEDGVRPTVSRKAKPPGPLPVPADLTASLKKSSVAMAAFEKLSPSHRREYVEWITDAKLEATRQRRIARTVEQLSEGKSLNWKYARQ